MVTNLTRRKSLSYIHAFMVKIKPQKIKKIFNEIIKNKLGLIGIIILTILLFFAIFGSFLTPYSPDDKESMPFLEPSKKHILGTDHLGHDIFTLLVHGSKISLMVSFFSTIMGVILIGLRTVSRSYRLLQHNR